MSLKNNWKPTDTLRNTDVNDIANEVNKNTEHKETKITNTDGVHGIRYDESSQELKYKDASQGWQTIPTGQQAEEDLRLHEEKKVASTEGVHGFRYNSKNETLEIESVEGQWTEVGGGLAGALLSPVTNIKVKAGNTKLTVSWTDSIEGTWAGTKLVYKVGSYPENPKDGTLAVDNKVKDQYKDTGFNINALNNGTKYYFAFFPYDTKNKYSLNVDNRTIGTPQVFRTMTAKINLNDSNPATCISYHDDATEMTPGDEQWDEFFGYYSCLLKNGKQVGKLQKTDRTKFEDGNAADIVSGDAGDCMVFYPLRGYKLQKTSTELIVSVTDDPNKEGYCYKHCSRGDSVKSGFYLGSFKGFKDSSGKLRSLSGKTITTNLSLDAFRIACQANGTGYEQSAFYQLQYRICIYVLKYKNLNSQDAIGGGQDRLAYATPTGSTNTQGMDWGTPRNYTNKITLQGLEDFWGANSEWVDGIFVDNSRKFYTTTTNFKTYSGYQHVGTSNTFDYGGYAIPKYMFGSNDLGFLMDEQQLVGSITTHCCDFTGVSFPTSTAVRIGATIGYGANYSNKEFMGIFAINVTQQTNEAATDIASRLMYIEV